MYIYQTCTSRCGTFLGGGGAKVAIALLVVIEIFLKPIGSEEKIWEKKEIGTTVVGLLLRTPNKIK